METQPELTMVESRHDSICIGSCQALKIKGV